jgi:hypothetical protein
MRALTVIPGRAGSAEVTELADFAEALPPSRNDVKVVLALGA